jgi:maltooligosyltrehalose trehalohydrolase
VPQDPRLPFDLPLGARPRPRGTEFRVWAPRAEQIALRVGGDDQELADEGFGIRSATLEAPHGTDYVYVVDGEELPDPCSRHQPHGLRGASRVVDPATFEWTDGGFSPPALEALVLYELHVGTFTQEGTFDAAIAHLAELRELGVNAVELMPVAEFPGRHGWGYDGVYLNAAQSSYGGPEGLQRLVDAAHGHGIAVILDVVYNHLGASGVKAMEAFGPYFTDKHETGWGKAVNLDDEDADPVREWILQSAEGWVLDFHLDGLRLDAIHAIRDDSAEHLVAAIARRVHGANHEALVIAESGLNDPKVMRLTKQGGWGCDAAWADDFHHSLRTLLTDDRGGYYEEFGRIADLVKAYHRPHVHDGVYSTFRKRRFGAKADDIAPERFVVFAQNHDQVGNRAFGDRLPVEARPLAAFATLLAPFTPMLFMGEEYGERAPFQFFSDHIDEEIAVATREGRRREFAAFAEFAGEEVPDPQDPATFERSKLTREGEPGGLRDLYAALIAQRGRLDAVGEIEASEEQRWLTVQRGSRTLAMNFASQERRIPVPPGRGIELATHPARIEDGCAVLAPLSGALVA